MTGDGTITHQLDQHDTAFESAAQSVSRNIEKAFEKAAGSFVVLDENVRGGLDRELRLAFGEVVDPKIELSNVFAAQAQISENFIDAARNLAPQQETHLPTMNMG